MAGLAEIVQDPNYVNANAETKAAIFEKHAPNDPNYANANPETQAAIREKFGVTPGGAAVGNPSIMAQGRKGLGLGFNLEPAATIGAATGMGAGLGYASKEILTGAGNLLGGLPHPFAQRGAGFLKGAGQVIGAGGRAVPTTLGAISGATAETAGQTVEAVGGGPVAAETARFVGGAAGPESVKFAKWALEKVIAAPALSVWHKVWKSGAQEVLSKLEKAPETLTQKEREYLDKLIAEIRGPAGKDNAPLEEVGSIMGQRGRELMDAGDQQIIAAQQRASGVKLPPGAEMADIGTNLQSTINTRYKGAIEERSKAYKANEAARDAIVTQREGAGQTIDTTPEYRQIVANLKKELKPGLHSPDVASDFENILKQISTKVKTQEQPFGGMGADPFASINEKKPPVSFQQIDEVRRQLGEVFRGKAPEGYKAIDAETARKYYAQLSELQKKYAGSAQEKLLDDYAEKTVGLEKFSSKYGKKSTALDQYREDTFATDPSALPGVYFKTRASVKSLKELTGNESQVNHAALEYANKQLAGKDADGVRKWLSANSEWLAETGPTRTLIDRYATKLEAVEKQVSIATDFAKQMTGKAEALIGKGIPANQATALILSKNANIWNDVLPAIQNSPQAKTSMVNAVRQVVANRATSKETSDLFELSIRPFLERSNIASKAEMDFIAQKLASIQEMKVPEAEKLGHVKRMLLEATGGWAASAAGRGAVWAKEKVVPD